jgi:uncharacterized protein YkwD
MSKTKKILCFTATVVTALCFIYALAVLATQQAETAPKTTAATLQKAEPHIFTVDELLAEANKLRAEKGVAPLTLDPRLNESAQWKAQDMADYNYFGHVRNGYHGWQKVNELAPECVAAENIEWSTDFSDPFSWWITSKPHYEAILDPIYDSTGFGIVNDNGKMLYVEHFCDL